MRIFFIVILLLVSACSHTTEELYPQDPNSSIDLNNLPVYDQQAEVPLALPETLAPAPDKPFEYTPENLVSQALEVNPTSVFIRCRDNTFEAYEVIDEGDNYRALIFPSMQWTVLPRDCEIQQ